MASEDRLRELEEKYENYKVYDNRGEKIGKVDDLFVDETDREEYIGVKLGLLGMKSTLIPMEMARVNEGDRSIEVSESKDRVKEAPSFDDDEDITPEYEERIRSHFGLGAAETSAGSYGSSSGTDSGQTEEQDSSESRDYGTRGSSTDDLSVDTEYGERAGSTTEGSSGSRDVPEYQGAGGSSDDAEHRGTEGSHDSGDSRQRDSAESETSVGGTGSSSDEATREVPTTRQTEETETYREGGRTKVRRRIVREEIVEEDADSSS